MNENKIKVSSAVMVTYNPNESTLQVIERVLETGVFLIVIDNGTVANDIILNRIEHLVESKNCKFLRFENNKGLATAQNAGIEISKKLKKEFIFFFDQDTIIPKNFINDMLELFLKYEKLNPNNQLGILAPNYFDRNTKEYAHYAYLTKKSYEDKKFLDEQFLEVSFAISSGSLMRVRTIEKIGNFIDEFFIDQIDTEYCLRMKKNGYKVVATSGALLNHTIGDREKKRFLGLTIKPNHHSELRKYYIFRNGMYTVNQYGSDFPGFRVLMIKRFIHDFLGVCLYEKNKKKKISSMIKGIKDSKKGDYTI